MSSESDIETEKFFQDLIFTKNIDVVDKKLLLLGRPGAILNLDVLVSLFKPLLDVNPKILEDAGSLALKGIMMDYKKRFSDPQQILDFIKKTSPLYGAGGLDFSIQKDKIIVSIQPSVFAEEYVKLFGASDKPVCYFSRGILSQLFGSIFNRNLVFDEVNCVAKGDGACVFVANL
ncbi:MAG: V4R domain-containing protein [Nanoarchaeota archaeon]|nr:V4R domain-containing protein [Nanoarchaeota archaeon]